MTETFTFAQINFSEDAQLKQRRQQNKSKIRGEKQKNVSNTRQSRTGSTANRTQTSQQSSSPSSTSSTISTARSRAMSLFATPKIIAHPSFNSEKYIQTPLGLINKSFFSISRARLDEFSRPQYIREFPYSVVRDASKIISESDSVLKFVLEHLKQLPCNVPIRWGVLFNSKFRRIFQCLTVDKWIQLGKVLEQHGYARSQQLNIYLLNPEIFDNLPLRSQLTGPTEIDPFRDIDQNGNVSESRPITPIPSIIPVDSPAVTPVPRAQNDSIYAISYLNSTDPDSAPRFQTDSFDSVLTHSIRILFNYNEEPFTVIYRLLNELPVEIPLRWGCIYNQRLRVRRRIATNSDINLAQWKELKEILKNHGRLDDKTVTNCAILKNKN